MIVCLAGMHRSGTSLFSSYLRYCGINMGEKLAPPGSGNKYGHFEDKEFLNLHKEILKDNNRHMFKEPEPLIIRKEHHDLAQELIEKNNNLYEAWGWKDPRSTLFLEFWNKKAQEIKYIFLYRDPLTVIDSLFRRKGDRNLYFNPLLAADAWLLYNRRILDFYKSNRASCFIANINGINSNHSIELPKLADWLSYKLDKPYEDIYKPKEIATSLSTITKLYKPIIGAFRGNELNTTYEDLESIAQIKSYSI